MNTELPKDLGGWQNVRCGFVEFGDIAVRRGKMQWAHRGWMDAVVKPDGETEDGARIYRKIPVARQGLSDDGKVLTSSDATTEAKALTYDSGKPALAVLPTAGLREMAKVQQYGHAKYGDFYNYRKGMEISRQLSCAIRHIYEVMDGNDIDAESGCHHLGHAMTRLAFVLQNIADGTLIDDRFKQQEKAS